VAAPAAQVDFAAAVGYVALRGSTHLRNSARHRGAKEGMMAYDASPLLGSQQIAGVRVLPFIRGMQGAREARPFSVRDLFGFGTLMLGRSPVIPAQTPKVKRPGGYLTVTDSELALVQLKGARTPVEVTSRIPRNTVVSAEVGTGLSPLLTIALADGKFWQFQIPNPGILAIVPGQNYRKQGRHVAAVLSGVTAGL
jgi:hypothetical protein